MCARRLDDIEGANRETDEVRTNDRRLRRAVGAGGLARGISLAGVLEGRLVPIRRRVVIPLLLVGEVIAMRRREVLGGRSPVVVPLRIPRALFELHQLLLAEVDVGSGLERDAFLDRRNRGEDVARATVALTLDAGQIRAIRKREVADDARRGGRADAARLISEGAAGFVDSRSRAGADVAFARRQADLADGRRRHFNEGFEPPDEPDQGIPNRSQRGSLELGGWYGGDTKRGRDGVVQQGVEAKPRTAVRLRPDGGRQAVELEVLA